MTIIKGDGTWQDRLDADRCPKCGGTIVHQVVPSHKRHCKVCKLTIVDSKPRSDKMDDDTMPSEWEGNMYETRLMPTEDQIMADAVSAPAIEWKDAVSMIEGVVTDKLDYMNDYPADYTEQDKINLEAAWKRILRG